MSLFLSSRYIHNATASTVTGIHSRTKIHSFSLEYLRICALYVQIGMLGASSYRYREDVRDRWNLNVDNIELLLPACSYMNMYSTGRVHAPSTTAVILSFHYQS